MNPIRLLAVAVFAAGLAAPQGQAQVEPGTEPPGFHGMLVLGTETIYISHLPMFVPRHRYQAIWEVTFGADADRQYRSERARPDNAGKIFTLAPKESFRLPDLITTKTSFKADVFVGHFEREANRLLLGNTTVTLKKRVHFHPFRHGHARPPALTYLLFGKGGELFLAHWISFAPNFDHILVASPATALTEIPPGAVLTVLGRSDTARLEAGQSASGVLVAERGSEQPFLVTPVDIRVVSEYYFEQGELTDVDPALKP